jgi:hypothetical protein
MKRLLVKALIICPAAGLILSAFTLKHYESSGRNKEIVVSDPDTSDSEFPIKIDPFKIEVVPPSSGIQFYRDGFVFLSHSKIEDRMITDHVSFGTLDTYYAALKDTVIGEHVIFSSSEPFAVPSESMTFNSDYSVMYFAKRLKSDDSEKIYKAEYQSGNNGSRGWTSDKNPLPICSDNSTYTHPALSASGNMLVFSSNRRGTSGGQDLYITHKVGDSWSSPENLGKSVNTNGNELFPFLDKENNLYFSSDGYKGIGGYDIYFSKFNGKYWDKPVNLSKRINSQDDELAFKINPKEGNTAFLSVRPKSDAHSFKIFRITFADPYSQNRYSDLSNALRFVAGIDVSPFKTTGQDSSVLAQTGISRPGTLKSQKDSGKQSEPKTEQSVKVPEKLTNPRPAQAQEQPEAKPEITKSLATSESPAGPDEITYRIQFMASSKSKGSFGINIGDKDYNTFEYLYNGLYRTCAGEFNNVASARNFQNQVKQAGYNDAFVVAFKNGQRVDLRTSEKAGQVYTASTQTRPADVAQTNAASNTRTEIKPDVSKPAEIGKSQSGPGEIVYRIQILTSSNSKGSYNITIGDNLTRTFEYFFNGSYRTCVGEFGTAASAREFLKLVKQAGYQDAFVVVFKNNQRLMDPALLK